MIYLANSTDTGMVNFFVLDQELSTFSNLTLRRDKSLFDLIGKVFNLGDFHLQLVSRHNLFWRR
jgi:hypothetical protein